MSSLEDGSALKMDEDEHVIGNFSRFPFDSVLTEKCRFTIDANADRNRDGEEVGHVSHEVSVTGVV
jgi:hypothetical protein